MTLGNVDERIGLQAPGRGSHGLAVIENTDVAQLLTSSLGHVTYLHAPAQHEQNRDKAKQFHFRSCPRRKTGVSPSNAANKPVPYEDRLQAQTDDPGVLANPTDLQHRVDPAPALRCADGPPGIIDTRTSCDFALS